MTVHNGPTGRTAGDDPPALPASHEDRPLAAPDDGLPAEAESKYRAAPVTRGRRRPARRTPLRVAEPLVDAMTGDDQRQAVSALSSLIDTWCSARTGDRQPGSTTTSGNDSTKESADRED
jgi:hypothetical protein